MKKNSTWLLLLIFTLSACSTPVVDNGRLKVVATTTIVADIVSQVGGDRIDLTVLLPAGSDPHSFQAAPKHLAAIADADIVFFNGLGLEEFLSSILDNAGGDAVFIPLSDAIPNLLSNQDSDHEEFDPHVWLKPTNIFYWIEIIVTELSQLDQANSSYYLENAESFQIELGELDAWILEQVNSLASSQRKMVADHHAWAYFANAYGFDLVGTVIPGYSSLVEPSAKDLAALEELIALENVEIIFVTEGINPALSSRVAEDTGIKLIALYTGSLSDEDGPAGDYISMMRHNVTFILESINH